MALVNPAGGGAAPEEAHPTASHVANITTRCHPRPKYGGACPRRFGPWNMGSPKVLSVRCLSVEMLWLMVGNRQRLLSINDLVLLMAFKLCTASRSPNAIAR
jgi:hypothetical protein